MSKVVTYPLPSAFTERLKQEFPHRYSALIEAFDQKPSTFIRLNSNKLDQCPFPSKTMNWDNQVHRLEERPSFVMDPLFHAGGYYPQEGSSTLLKLAYESIPRENERPIIVVDLCAAPGGKSTHLISLIKAQDVLLSNEIVGKRYPILKENLTKWGHPNIILTKVDPYYLGKIEALADIVLVDAPCSGEGLFRKQMDWRKSWDTHQAELCATRQSKILQHAHKLLKVGGHLIYSTCTMHSSENMSQVKQLSQDFGYQSLDITKMCDVDVDEIQEDGLFGYQCLPDKFQGEPFFIALLKKEGNPLSKKADKNRYPSYVDNQDVPFLNQQELYWNINEEIILANEQLFNIGQRLKKNKIHFDYLPLATIKGEKAQPTHFSAMSKYAEQVPDLNLSQEEALAYLRGEVSSSLTPKAQKNQWVLAKYQGLNLGWLKQVGSRYNNKYPKDFRLRKK